MSYEKVRSLTFNDKKMTISMNYTCSNDDFGPRTHNVQCDESNYDETKRLFFDDLVGCSLQFTRSSKSKAHYAFLKSIEFAKEKFNFIGLMDLWYSDYDEEHVFTKEKTHLIKDEMYKVFCQYLNEKVPKNMVKVQFARDSGENVYLVKSSKFSYRFCRMIEGGKEFPYLHGLNLKVFPEFKDVELIVC